MISLSGLNAAQRQAAEIIEGPVLILAGAGSGKTRTITYRIAHMVDNLHIDQKSILAVSFTNKAAKEMRERIIGLLGKKKSRGLTMATFHSLGVKILKKEITKLGYHKNFSIYDSSDQIAIVREALKNFKAGKQFDQKIIMGKIGKLKNMAISADDFANSEFFDDEDPYDHAIQFVYEYYEDKLKFYNAIDFDDILFLTVKLFEEFPEVAKEYSRQFRYIMVDEYQDTNTLQFSLIMALTTTHNNLCVVGDDDQAIYSFRGADITNILSFERNYPGAVVVKLEENYRSVSPILELANKVIKENINRRDKTLWSQRKSNTKPLLWLMADTDHEAEVIADEISKYQSNGGHLGDISILYRSNLQAQPFEDIFRMNQIPYTIIGGQKFYEKKEVKDIMAYLTVILNPRDQLQLRRILNIPNRGIGSRTLEKYLEKSESEGISLYQALFEFPALDPNREEHIRKFTAIINKYKEVFDTTPLPQAISTLIEDIDFYKFIEKQYDSAKQVERRKNDVHFFVESAERFVKYNGAHATLKNFVEKLLLQDNQDSKDDDEEDDDVRKNEVTMMTFHSSKGLEFHTVYMVGVEEESLPHKNTIKNGEDISEERRLCYVGITRAQQKLVMTYCKERKQYGKQAPRHISRFINELDKEGFCVLQDRTTFGHMTEEEADDYKRDFFSSLHDSLDDDSMF
ncbi:ATP-dependent helicase [Halobacteriovorax sp. HLS]|uniref:ATP-dependent helicase n=1 Tax=Halobacteriovorax sp. HLS TaxID=2234000 RepID=UPI000FDBCFD1|nr:UvrD-helicase domain-containing protein [Halobacteriovorax sp. HLS]